MKHAAIMLLAFYAMSQSLTSSLAGEVVPLEVSGPKLFADYDKKAKAAKNISGIACTDNGSCVVVADEMVAIQSLTVKLEGDSATYMPGRHYGRLFGDDVCESVKKEKKCKERDLEGIAVRDRTFLVTGSMANKRKSGKKTKKNWFLARFDLADDGDPVDGTVTFVKKRKILKRLFSRHDALSASIGMPLQCGGLNIEGLAVAGDKLFFGLRGPANYEKGQAFVVEANLDVFDADGVGKTKLHKLRFIDENKMVLKNAGIRALETFGNRLLIATVDARVPPPETLEEFSKLSRKLIRKCSDGSDEDDDDIVLNFRSSGPLQPRIWIWDPAGDGDPMEIARLGGAYRDQKLEGIAVLKSQQANAATVDLLLTIDDPEKGVSALAVLSGVEIPASQ